MGLLNFLKTSDGEYCDSFANISMVAKIQHYCDVWFVAVYESRITHYIQILSLS